MVLADTDANVGMYSLHFPLTDSNRVFPVPSLSLLFLFFCYWLLPLLTADSS